jgi:hypothetical protein
MTQHIRRIDGFYYENGEEDGQWLVYEEILTR